MGKFRQNVDSADDDATTGGVPIYHIDKRVRKKSVGFSQIDAQTLEAFGGFAGATPLPFLLCGLFLFAFFGHVEFDGIGIVFEQSVKFERDDPFHEVFGR